MIAHDLIKQKYIERSLIKTLTQFDLCGMVTLQWFSGLTITVAIEAISECDNDKELNDPEYMDFMAAFARIINVKEFTMTIDEVMAMFGSIPNPGIGYVIAFDNAPDLILDGDTVIWKKPEIPNHAQSDICNS